MTPSHSSRANYSGFDAGNSCSHLREEQFSGIAAHRSCSLHDGGRRGEVVQAHSTCLNPHRDRTGLTFPTSSAEQVATPERSLNSARGRWLLATVRSLIPPRHTAGKDQRSAASVLSYASEERAIAARLSSGRCILGHADQARSREVESARGRLSKAFERIC
jgi:hypothetical protein